MLTVILAILVLCLALLAIPVMLTFQISWQQEFQGQVDVQWAFGLVRFRLPTQAEQAGQKSHARKPRRTPGKKMNIPALIRAKAFRRRIFRYLADCWHAIHKRNLQLRMRIGLGDPADTGQLWALLGPASGMLSRYQDAALSIEPDFVDTTFELDGSGNIRFIPLQLISLTLGLFLSPSIWLGLRKAGG